MTAESWTEKSRVLAAAGLVVMGRDAQKIEQLSNLGPLIEAANVSETRLLTGQSIDELLSIVPTEELLLSQILKCKLTRQLCKQLWQDPNWSGYWKDNRANHYG